MLSIFRSCAQSSRAFARLSMPSSFAGFATFILPPQPSQLQFKPKFEHPVESMSPEFNYSIRDYPAPSLRSPPSPTKIDYSKPITVPLKLIPFVDAMGIILQFVNDPEFAKISFLTLDQIIATLREYLPRINLDNVTVIVWALSRLDSFPQDIAVRTEQVIKENLKQLEPNEVAIITWAYAKMGLGSNEFWSVFIPYIVQIMPRMSEIDLTQIAWGLTKIHHENDATWKALETNVRNCLKELERSQSISIFLMSFAKMEKGTNIFWEKLESKFSELAPKLEEQALTNAIWALAKRGKLSFLNSKELEKMVIRKLDSLKDIEIASISWSFDKLEQGTEAFWNTVSSKISTIIRADPASLQILTLCSYVWVLRRQSEVKWDDWNLLEKQFLLKKIEIQPRYLYSITASFAMAKQGSEYFWKELEGITLNLLNQLDTKTLTNIIWSFATRGKGSQQLWEAFSLEVVRRIPTMTAQGMVISLWGLAKSRQDFKDDNIGPIIEQVNNVLYPQLKAVDIGLLLWSIGKLQYRSEAVDNIVRTTKERIKQGEEIPLIDLIQIISAINELNVGDRDFWEITERILTEKVQKIKKEGWGILMNAIAHNAEFSEEFLKLAETQILKGLPDTPGGLIVTFIRSFYMKGVIDPKLWTSLEGEVIKKLETLDDNALAECTTILSLRKITQNEFWQKASDLVGERLDRLKTPTLARLVKSFGISEKGSIVLWDKIEEKLIKKLEQERFLTSNVIIQILVGFSNKKKGGNEFWLAVENRIIKLLNEERLREHDLWTIIVEFAKVKRGSRRLWVKLVELLIANTDKLSFKKILIVISSLDRVEEIGKSEKKILNSKWMERLLRAESDFGQYLDQLSTAINICKKLTDEELKQITQKVAIMSGKASDSSTVSQMQRALKKIETLRPEPVEKSF